MASRIRISSAYMVNFTVICLIFTGLQAHEGCEAGAVVL
jgi:hypothetical protein